MISNLLLDLDGTLVDSSPGIYHSFCLACDKFSLSAPSYSLFCSLIGPPIQDIARQLFSNLDHSSIEEFRQIFRDDYDDLRYKMHEWYPGVLDTISSLKTSLAIDISIITNKPTHPALDLIESAGLISCISRIIGIDYLAIYDSGPVFSSKADALSYIIRLDSLDLRKSVYVGDTYSDLEACEHCKLPFIAALYGFHIWHPQQTPPHCINYFGEIKSFLS